MRPWRLETDLLSHSLHFLRGSCFMKKAHRAPRFRGQCSSRGLRGGAPRAGRWRTEPTRLTQCACWVQKQGSPAIWAPPDPPVLAAHGEDGEALQALGPKFELDCAWGEGPEVGRERSVAAGCWRPSVEGPTDLVKMQAQ